jgi:HlyD family secretion protein
MTRLAQILIASAALFGATACSGTEPPSALRATGYVEATDLRLASRVPGRVAEVHVVEGQAVSAGATIAVLSTAELDLALGRARAERAQADALWRLLRSGTRAEDVDQARAQLAAAEADARAVGAERAAAAADEARFEQLLQRQAGSVKQRDDARARREVGDARVGAAADRVTAARATLAKLSAGARSEELEAAAARVAAADAQIATLSHDKREAVVTAPSAGTVTARLVEPGELVGPGAPVAVMVDLDRAWVNAYFEEPLVPRLRIGQAAEVVTDAGSRLAGTIAAIASRAEFTPRNVQTSDERARLVYRVKVTVDNREGILKPGMPVEVDVK